MTEENKKQLSDILIAIELIEDFTSDIDDFKSYQLDFKTQSAVERPLIIIGNALNNIKKLMRNLKLIMKTKSQDLEIDYCTLMIILIIALYGLY